MRYEFIGGPADGRWAECGAWPECIVLGIPDFGYCESFSGQQLDAVLVSVPRYRYVRTLVVEHGEETWKMRYHGTG